MRPPGGSFAERTGQPHFRCLGQRPGASRIYACADNTVDGYALYASDDAAQTFKPLMKFTDLQGPLTCQPVQSNCAAHWERIQTVLGIRPSGSSSHCSSLGADGTALLVLITFSLRRART